MTDTTRREPTAFCSILPDADHAGCPSSIECHHATTATAWARTLTTMTDPARRLTESVKTSDLRTGDVVITSGLRVLLGERSEYPDHASTGTTVYAFRGTILNPEYLQTDGGRYLFGGIIPLDGSSGWTIQGNDWARWARTLPPQV